MNLLPKLPGELRNTVYENIAKDDCFFIRPKSNDKPFSVVPHYLSPMYNAPDQINAEYISHAASSASIINTIVYDFNFSHVEEFLDSLSEKDMEALPTIETPSNRRFIINLKFTGALYLANLDRWLDQFRCSCNKGFEVEFGYIFPQSEFTKVEGCAMALLT
jgi:hypothetical protein